MGAGCGSDPATPSAWPPLARRLHRPVTPADLLADEAFDGIELDAGQILPAGLRPARAMPLPEGVRATLRPYQRAGVDWLTWLADNRIGGILADDMGLGKTLQVLTLRSRPTTPGPTLVVCPVTLVDTWARQSAQFTPDLRVRAFHGAARGSIADAAADADILVTTYGLLARDESLAQGRLAPGGARRGPGDQEPGHAGGPRGPRADRDATGSWSPARRWRTTWATSGP